MTQVELGSRYRAGREGCRIVFRDGSVTQLAPFASFRFEHHPLKIEGRLVRVRRGHLVYDAPALEPGETKQEATHIAHWVPAFDPVDMDLKQRKVRLPPEPREKMPPPEVLDIEISTTMGGF